MLIAVVVVAFFLVCAFAAHYFSDDQQTRRAIAAAPFVPIGQAQAGATVKLVGKVAYAGETLRAPLTGRRCAYYLATVEEYRSNGKSGSWHAILRESDGVDFLVVDATGRARVPGRRVKAVAVQDASFQSGTFEDATPVLETFLARHGQQSRGWIFNRSLRYKEAVFEQGETVAVVGKAGFEHDPEAASAVTGYRDAPRRVVLEASQGEHVLASDDPSVIGPAPRLPRAG